MELSEEKYHTTASKIEGSVSSQMFGKLCYKINGKPFVSYFQDTMVFKLTGDIHAKALSLPGAQLFDPSGKHRPMREWVQVPIDHEGDWDGLAEAAADYVSGL